MNHISDTIVSFISWPLIALATIMTEGDRQVIMFILGAVASVVTIASKVYDFHLKRKANKK